MNFKNIVLIIFCFLISIHFVYNNLLIPEFAEDTRKQTIGTLNLINNEGYSYPLENDLCEENQFRFLNEFPIGYSLLTMPFFYFSNNILLQIVIYKSVFSIFLFVLIFSIFKKNKADNLSSIFFSGLFIFLGLKGYIGDTITLTFLIFSIYLFSFSKKFIFNTILASFILFFTCVLRYAYYPQIVVFPVAYFLFYLINKDKINLKKMFLLLGITIFFIGSYFIWMKFNVSNLNSLNEIKSAQNYFNFEHILHFRPVFIDFFVDTYRLYRLAGFEFLNNDYDRGVVIPLFLRVLLLLISLSIFTLSHVYLFFKALKMQNEHLKKFILTILVASVLNISFIYLLSIYYESIKIDYIWTWAMLQRYFMINYFALCLSLFIYIVQNEKYSKVLLTTTVFFFAINFLDFTRLTTKIYSTSYKTNLEIIFPKSSISSINSFYLNYANERSKYCILLDKSDFKNRELNWLNYYSKFLNFPIIDSEDTYGKVVIMGDKSIYLIKNN